MANYRKSFELDIQDLQLIEHSLTKRVGELSSRVLDAAGDSYRLKDCPETDQNMDELNAIRDLLGRLHGQKIWYEPKESVPRG